MMKKLNLLLILLAVLPLLLLPVVFARPNNENGNKVRVIAHTDKEISGALEKGCEIVREAKTLKALICSEDAASSLGLQEDVKVFVMDTTANTQIRADQVQSSGNTGSEEIIAVLDTGVDYNHPQLSDSILKGRDFVDNDNDPMDLNGHGTHVAGIITANSGTAKGVAPNAKVLTVRVLDASGSGYFSDVIAAIYYVVNGPDGLYGTTDDFNAVAISMSLGTNPPYTYNGYCDNVLPDLTNAIKYALDRGVIVVVAAGNSGNSGVSIPGCISYSTTVGAVDSNDRIASFSGRGKAVDIVAPGVSIYSSWLGNSYATASGTSMATPMVSGTVALIKSTHPGYTVSQVQDALFKTAKDLGTIGFDTSYGYGRVDALKAVSPAPSVPSLSLSASPSTITTAQSSTITASTSDKFETTITFTTTLGTLSAQSCTTTSGSCTVTFTSTTAGTATITGTATGYTSGSITVIVTQAPVPYSATFSETGLPTSTTWGVTVGGKRYTSTISSVKVSGLTGKVSYIYDSTITVGKTRYTCTTGCSGSVTSTNNIKTATYKIQSRSSGSNN
jgi:hypothetical protein